MYPWDFNSSPKNKQFISLVLRVQLLVYWDFKTKVNMPLHKLAFHSLLWMNCLSPLNIHTSPCCRFFSAWPGISNKNVALHGKVTSRAGGILKFLKHHCLYVNLETDFKESNTILSKFILLRSLPNTLNLSHHYSLLAEAIKDLSKIHTEKLTNISLISRIYCRCSKFLKNKKTKMKS